MMKASLETLASASLLATALSVSTPAFGQQSDADALREELHDLRERLSAVEAELERMEKREQGNPAGEEPMSDTRQNTTSPAAAFANIRSNSSSCYDHSAIQDNNASLVKLAPQLAPTDRNGEAARSSFQLLATTDKTTATLRLATELNYVCAQDSSDANSYLVRASNFNFTASAPLNKTDDGRTNVGTLDGLSSGAKLSLGWNFRSLGFSDGGAPSEELVEDAVTRCASIEGKDRTSCLSEFRFPPPGVQGLDERAFVVRYLGEEAGYDYDGFGFSDVGFIAGLNASLAYDEFKFVDLNTAGSNEESRLGFGVGGHLGLVFPNDGNSLFAAYEFQRSFKASPNAAFCPDDDAVVGSILQCRVGAAGEPERKIAHLASLEFRHSASSNFAIAPRLTFDLEEDRFGVDVPIYLIASKDGGLTGGLRLGFVSEDEDEMEDEEFIFGVFVDTPFSLFSN